MEPMPLSASSDRQDAVPNCHVILQAVSFMTSLSGRPGCRWELAPFYRSTSCSLRTRPAFHACLGEGRSRAAVCLNGAVTLACPSDALIPFHRMWTVWMFTVPSLRARECLPKEKDALNLLFIAIPLLNVTLPFLWKSFPFIYTADVIALFATYYWKGVWKEVYGIPLGAPGSDDVITPSE